MESLVGRLPAPAFWAGRKVFLTGHTGFKGGWLSLWLTAMGAKVHGFSLPPPTEPNFFAAIRLDDLVDHEIGDIRDAALLATSLRRFAPEIVIHMAAQPLVLFSYQQPLETYATNVMGTAHLLEAVRACASVQATIIVTSDKCYENTGSIWSYRETDRMGGHDPYSNSKGCAELLTAAYARSFFSPAGRALGSVRAGNVIGGGDWAPDRLMTDIFAALLANRPPVLRAPQAVRPWQHVLEPLAGYLVAAEHLAAAPQAGAAEAGAAEAGAAWNFGPDADSEVNVATVADRVCALWGGASRPVHEETAARGKEARLLTLDSTKARRDLGWRPRWGLDRALTETVRWFQAWGAGSKNMKTFSLGQIADYTGAAQTLPDQAKEVA